MKKINNNSSAVLAVISIIIAAVMVFSFGCVRKDEKEIMIGVVLSLTGKGATYGERALKGMQLATEELNVSARFKNRPIKLLIEDSNSSAQQALSGFRKLIELNHIFVVVGLVLSDEVLTCAPIANEKKVVLFSTAAGSDKIKDAGDYVFRNRESAALQSQKIAGMAVQDLGYKEIAILHSKSANGISYSDNFRATVENLGGKILVTAGYDEGNTDYRSELVKLRVKAPKAVYLAGLDNEIGLILRQAKELGFKTQFLSSPGAISQKVIQLAGNAAEGLICGSASFDIESSDPHIRIFIDAFKHKYGEEPDFIAANSYDAIYMLAGLFEKSGPSNGEQIKQGLYGVKEFPGVGGTTTFDSNGEVIKPIGLVQVRQGKFQSFMKNP